MMKMNIISLRTVTSGSKISWSSLRLKEVIFFVYSSIPSDSKGEIEGPDLVKNRQGATPS